MHILEYGRVGFLTCRRWPRKIVPGWRRWQYAASLPPPPKSHHHRRLRRPQLLRRRLQEGHQDGDQQVVVPQGGIEGCALACALFLEGPLQRRPEGVGAGGVGDLELVGRCRTQGSMSSTNSEQVATLLISS